MPMANHRIFIILSAATAAGFRSPSVSPSSIDMESAEYLAALIAVLEQVALQRYMVTAAFVFLLWDLLITFDMEVERIWMSRDTAFKVFWSFLRYLPVAGITLGLIMTTHPAVVSSQVVVPLAITASVFSSVAYLFAHLAFITRTYALYSRDNRILYVLVPLLVGEMALVFSVVGLNVPRYYASLAMGALPDPEPPKVIEIPSREFAIAVWCLQGLFDCVVFGLTLHKTICLSKARVQTPILPLLFRDGCGYFVAMILLYSINILLEIFGSLRIRSVNASLASVFPVVLSQRIILNLRSLSRPGPSDMDSFGELTRPHELQAVAAAVEAPPAASGFEWKDVDQETYDSASPLTRPTFDPEMQNSMSETRF
ncbi:hypothetical protein EXIGLDRAFT_828551 [Exidia glandulosa HHB12029]|uniref:DUF6533 domain-containing protein n=1 Tax=Exidia glandulosa HHB12029 TaxID=1314781 RepID=A0A165Q6S4_EXIGL|nr:hypothetical protein EXIGLDRAFT_828551 [Exidia glandulosa HHB12029]